MHKRRAGLRRSKILNRLAREKPDFFRRVYKVYQERLKDEERRKLEERTMREVAPNIVLTTNGIGVERGS